MKKRLWLRHRGTRRRSGSMGAGARSAAMLLTLCLLCGSASFGCHRGRAESEATWAEALASYDALQPKLLELKSTLTEVRKGVDELSDEVPGGADLRAKFFTAEEVLGVLDAKIRWLSGELDGARTSGKKEQLIGLRDEMAKTAADLAQVEKVAAELTHEKARLQRVAALLKAPFERVLPTGFRVKAAEGGVEARLLDFIEDAGKKVDSATWFEFDRLGFIEDGSELDRQASQSQLENVLQILRAYPSVTLRIGGHRDGAAAAAVRRSREDRAEAVRSALIEMGASPGRLEAGGGGGPIAARVTTK